MRIPPQYDEKIARATGSLLPYAVVLHCFCGMWMYSNKNIFQSQDFFYSPESLSSDESPVQSPGLSSLPGSVDGSSHVGKIFNRLFLEPVVYIFAFLVTLLTLAFVRFVILRRLGSFLKSLCPLCVKWLSSSDKDLEPEYYPNYFDTIPTDTLRAKSSQDYIKPHLRQLYEAALAKRKHSRVSLSSGLLSSSSSPQKPTDRRHDGKIMSGCYSYDLLENQEYIDAFAMDSMTATKRRLISVG